MISVLPSKNKEEIKSLFDKHSLEYNEFSGCVIAQCGEEKLGYCLYSLDSKKMIVLDIEPKNDLALADGILRSAIHNAVCAKVIKVYYSENAPVDIFEKLGFILSSKDKTLDVSKLFKSCHSCSEKNA